MEEHLRPALRKVILFLEEKGYRYAIIGGVALSQWGVARYTHDIDFKVLIPDLEYELARTNVQSYRNAITTACKQTSQPLFIIEQDMGD
jgi:hypothetical protein